MLHHVIGAGGFGQNLGLSLPHRLTKVLTDQPDRFQHAHTHFVCFNSIYCVCLTEGNAKLLYADGQDVKLMDLNTKLIEGRAKQRLSIMPVAFHFRTDMVSLYTHLGCMFTVFLIVC